MASPTHMVVVMSAAVAISAAPLRAPASRAAPPCRRGALSAVFMAALRKHGTADAGGRQRYSADAGSADGTTATVSAKT